MQQEFSGWYEAIGAGIGRLVDTKQYHYGDSFTKATEVLKILYPTGVAPEQYHNILCLVRILDKMFRIATNNDPNGESPYSDIAGYAMLGLHQNNNLKLGENHEG